MGRTQGIVPGIPQQANLAEFCISVTARPKEPIVMVDAGPPQDDPFPVEQQTIAPPFKGAQTEAGLRRIGKYTEQAFQGSTEQPPAVPASERPVHYC